MLTREQISKLKVGTAVRVVSGVIRSWGPTLKVGDVGWVVSGDGIGFRLKFLHAKHGSDDGAYPFFWDELEWIEGDEHETP